MAATKPKKIEAGKYQVGNLRVENWSCPNRVWICWVVLPLGPDAPVMHNEKPIHQTDTKRQAVEWAQRNERSS